MGRPRLATIDVETPERLLAAAEQELAAAGFDGAKLADIAARAGITRAALLYHFESKERLYEAVVGRAFASLGEIVRSAMSCAGSFRERLRAVVDGFLTYVSVHPALARIVVREVISRDGPGRAVVLAFGVPLLDDVVRFLESGREHMRKGAVPRAALMAVVSDVFLRAAAADVAPALWGDGDHTWAIAEALLLSQPAPPRPRSSPPSPSVRSSA